LYDNPDEQIPELFDYRPDDNIIEREHTVFKALANENRLRLLEALRHGERCGCELMVILDAPQSTVATHLRTLRDAGLVKNRKKGRWNYYRIADSAVMDLLDLATVIQED
jgi:ArsR family transcriptional regulator